MARGTEALDALDHPVVFVFFITLAVIGMTSILTWGFKRANMPGPAALTQHP